jgi:RNA polymerase sigma-70 factor (ECF subfamily)
VTSEPSPDDGRTAAFNENRPLLFSIAYRMLGSAADAEDIVQEAFLKWHRADIADVAAKKSYLSTMVTRLAIDHLESARVRREVYVGPWLPEPLVGVTSDDPLAAAALADSLSTAFLVLLERLNARERAAFLLREVFDFDYPEVARMLDVGEANARQIVKRAKQHIAAGKPRVSSDTRTAERLAKRFLDTCVSGDIDGLLAMLSPDVVAWADGGGKFAAARHPVRGADHVARFVASLAHKWSESGELRIAPVSGGLGLLFSVRGVLRAVLTVGSSGDAESISSVFVVVNPDKLAPIARQREEEAQ